MKRNTRSLILTIVVLAVILAGLLAVAGSLSGAPDDPTMQDTPSTGGSTTTSPSTQNPTDPSTEPSTAPSTAPTEPPIIKESTATIGAVGDILMHGDVIKSGYNSSDGSYDYNDIFTWFTSYISELDYAIANMEGTMCSDDNGYSYGGYPAFNCPDDIADALKNAGFDMMLTANNHTYDTRSKGFFRTQEVLADRGFDHTGTVASAEDDNYIIKEINGIRIGMICYTYNTGVDSDGSISLNTIPLTQANSQLVNSFNYSELDVFYDKLSGELEEMELAGAEATVLFIHWGDEYKLSPNSKQTSMAQELCDLGIDVIIGGHPHVVQPMELLTSTEDPDHKTVCLYSLGNALSNQRLGLISSCKTAHTEDGLLMSVTFAKYSDGTVVLESVNVLPTWVSKTTAGNDIDYEIFPLDKSISDWKSAFDLTDSELSQCKDSFDRTMDLVGEGLAEINNWCTDHQAAVEAALGVK